MQTICATWVSGQNPQSSIKHSRSAGAPNSGAAMCTTKPDAVSRLKKAALVICGQSGNLGTANAAGAAPLNDRKSAVEDQVDSNQPAALDTNVATNAAVTEETAIRPLISTDGDNGNMENSESDR